MSLEKNSKKKYFFKGIVFRKAMSKTATVFVEKIFKDKKVKKIVRKKSKFHVHDPLDKAAVGDEILFYEGRHISKLKCMYLHSIINPKVKV